MKILLVIFLGLLALVNAIFYQKTSTETPTAKVQVDNEDGKLHVPQLIEKYGYPVEVYNVTTDDGYILEVHRIPYGKKCGPGKGKRVAWLQHGLLGDSSNWLVAGPEKGLAYNLADECYDVWMGNYRGTTYGKNHVTLNPNKDKKQFWDFSWHEIGMHDIPAGIDFALNVTGTDGIYYVGHSMGTTGFWVCMSERPEYNSKIKLMSAYAPIAYTRHMTSPIRLIAPFEKMIDWMSHMFGMYEFLPSTKFMEFLGQTFCHQRSPFQILCSNILFLVAGYNSDQLDPELLPTILGHVPAGASSRSITHYGQGINTGKFRKYDYGRLRNLLKYGTFVPPEYNLDKVTAPVALYYGANDWLAAKADVLRLAAEIPNLKRLVRVNHDKYNHLDFLWAKDNIELINKQTIEFMKEY